VSADRYTSPAGDRRERAVPCQRCQRPTWALDALCDPCAVWAAAGGRSTSTERLAVAVAEQLASAPDHVVARSLVDLGDVALTELLGRLSSCTMGRTA
jgi:hypothetical protein